MKSRILKYTVLSCMLVLLLQGCIDGGNNNTSERSFSISVTNLTNSQPLSPVAVVLHRAGYSALTSGMPVSVGLEMLAESGDNTNFIAEADNQAMVSTTAAGSAVIAPGDSATVTLAGDAQDGTLLSLVSMLVNTNDAITTLNGVDLSGLSEDESITLYAIAYDAGTEANTEAMADIPGPAAGGEGFNALRNDRDFVVVHPGVIGNDDGLATSILDNAHRFDNPVARIVITRDS